MNKTSNTINWDEVPDIITKDQLYKLCHISKKTARQLLLSGAIPCVYTGKKTRCFRIIKDDVFQFIKLREEHPELYRVGGTTRRTYTRLSVPEEISDVAISAMIRYYTTCLSSCNDVLTTQEISEITEYGRKTVNNWCLKGDLKSFKKNSQYLVPKVFLIDYFCSFGFRSIINRTRWHNRAIEEIANILGSTN